MKIVSIMIMGEFSSHLDLNKISKIMRGVDFFPSKNPWMQMKLPPDNYHLSLSKSGKFMLSGVKNVEKISVIGQTVINFLNDMGISVNISNLKITNIVCLEKIELLVSIEKVFENLNSPNASYEPEQFPGLIYKNWGVCFLLFSSGKIIITGLKDIEMADVVLKKFLDEIK